MMNNKNVFTPQQQAGRMPCPPPTSTPLGWSAQAQQDMLVDTLAAELKHNAILARQATIAGWQDTYFRAVGSSETLLRVADSLHIREKVIQSWQRKMTAANS